MTITADILSEYLADAQALALNRQDADDHVTIPEAILTLTAVLIDTLTALQDIRYILDPNPEA